MADLDKHTKDQAIEFANNEAEIVGFPINGPKWKESYESYLKFAKGTMSVGRNPRFMPNPSVQSMKQFFPEVLGESGAAGEIARNYQGGPTSIDAIQQRILASATNMVKLFENGKGKKVRGKRTTGKVENSEMSDFQLPKRLQGESEEDYKLKTEKVLRAWVKRDLLIGLFIESLVPFFSLTNDDMEKILDLLPIKDTTVAAYQAGGKDSPRYQLLTNLHGAIGERMKNISFRKMILGSQKYPSFSFSSSYSSDSSSS